MSDLTDVFPTRRYLQRPPKETPFRGGLVSGARVGGHGWSFRAISQSKVTSRSPRIWCSTASRSGRNECLSRSSFPWWMPSSSPRPRDRSNARWTRHVLRLEDSAMKLVFLPHVREGMVPTASAGARAQASVGVRLESPGDSRATSAAR